MIIMIWFAKAGFRESWDYELEIAILKVQEGRGGGTGHRGI